MNEKLYYQQIDEYLETVDLQFLYGKSVLITGATGMIGSALIDLLLRNNEKQSSHIHIYALGRNYEKAAKRFNKYWSSKDFSFIQHDVVEKFPEDMFCDYIIHAASNAYPGVFAVDPVGTMAANFIGMYNILKLGRSTQVKRILYISSGEIYGDTTKNKKGESDYGYIDDMQVRSCYPISKRAAETLCVAFSKQYGISTLIVRPSHVYGPTMLDSDNRAVSSFLRDVAAGRDLVMQSEGTVIRSYTYVLDVCSALITVLAKGQSMEAYNVAGDHVVSIKQIAETIAALGHRKVIIDLPKSPDYNTLGFTTITRQVLDNRKLSSLGWKEKMDLSRGLKSTLHILA